MSKEIVHLPPSDFVFRSEDSWLSIAAFGMECKGLMVELGVRSALRKCIKCEGDVALVLAGSRNHLHLNCSTPGCLWMME